MRKAFALLSSVLTILLFVSVGFLQSTYAIPKQSGWESFWYTVCGGTGEAWSSLEWFEEGCFPVGWWPQSRYYDYRGLYGSGFAGSTFPPAEYYLDGVYVCHGDWVMYSVAYDDTFRFRWWIFWDPEDVPAEPGDISLSGCFMFSHGTGDFKFMHAFGEAWVEWTEPPWIFFQYHEGWILGAP